MIIIPPKTRVVDARKAETTNTNNPTDTTKQTVLVQEAIFGRQSFHTTAVSPQKTGVLFKTADSGLFCFKP